MLFSSLDYLLCPVILPVWHLHDWEPISYPMERKGKQNCQSVQICEIQFLLRYISAEMELKKHYIQIAQSKACQEVLNLSVYKTEFKKLSIQ